jgi:anti-sigma B factor antagonist
MEITIESNNDVYVVAINGKLDTNTTPDAEKKIDELIENSAKKLVIDFSSLDYISSAGLRLLLSITKKLKARGGNVRLCHLNEVVQEIFDISGFTSILTVMKIKEDALEGF